MGAGASVEVKGPLDKAKAKEIAGDLWPGTPRFEEAASTEGTITADQAMEFVDGQAMPAAAVVLDLTDAEVARLLGAAASSPGLSSCNVVGYLQQAALSPEDLEKLKAARRSKLRNAAEAALAEFAKLSDEEKAQAQNQGDIDLYSDEMQAIREGLFESNKEVNAQLDTWWAAATLYLDKDGDADLDKSEYAEFHKRLLRLLDDPDEQLSEEDALAAMQEDFAADAGPDGEVSKEEFRYAVFQLADQWTCTTRASEYVDFLRTSFSTVFHDLIENDKLRVPSSWEAAMKGGKKYNPLPESDVVERISELYQFKIKADAADDKQGKARDTMEHFILEYYEQKYGRGSKLFKKHFKAFVGGIFAAIDNFGSIAKDYITLFAQQVNIYSKSGRIKPLPPKATGKFLSLPSCLCWHLDFIRHVLISKTDFVVDHLEDILPLAKSTLDNYGLSYQGGMDGGGIANAKVKALVTGYAEALPARRIFTKQLSEMKIKADSPLYNAAQASFDALVSVESAHNDDASTLGGKIKAQLSVIPCIKFVVLTGAIAAAKLNS